MSHPFPTWSSVEDLAWVFGSPGLLAPETDAIVSDTEALALLDRGRAELDRLRRDPVPFHEFVEERRKSGRLGNYFESLLHYWLERILGYRRVRSGVAVRRGNETLGELDFAAENPDGTTEHWEAAVKFYMCVASNPGEAADMRFYVGQRMLDRLDHKVSRCIEHQVPLSELPEARAVLNTLGFAEPVRKRLLMKGRLFYPAECDWREQPGPQGISPSHLRGWWSAFDAGGTRLPEPNCGAWVFLPKERWLASPRKEDSEMLDSEGLQNALALHFASSGNAVQVAEVDPSGRQELSRGMILRPAWPREPIPGT